MCWQRCISKTSFELKLRLSLKDCLIVKYPLGHIWTKSLSLGSQRCKKVLFLTGSLMVSLCPSNNNLSKFYFNDCWRIDTITDADFRLIRPKNQLNQIDFFLPQFLSRINEIFAIFSILVDGQSFSQVLQPIPLIFFSLFLWFFDRCKSLTFPRKLNST